MAAASAEVFRKRVEPSAALIVGRTPENDLAIDHPLISRRHARIERSGGRWTVTDLGSTNGTFLNGTRLSGTATLEVGDVVDLGGSRLIRLDDSHLERRDYRGNTRVEAHGVAIDAGKRRLIEGVSLTLLPSELVGLMGPSGAGKTTLMTALNGYQPPSAGRVLYNGCDLYAAFDQFRLGIGYVPQDDILHGDLTVREALYFTAKLRLPGDTGRGEIDQRIERVLRQLHIDHIRDSAIGSPTRKVVSGGERKRVNVAMELLTDPPVLLLDEPTSGLSSEDALLVMEGLRELALEGRTILLTIHQPSREVFRLMDNLVVVSRDVQTRNPARVVYYGPAYPEAIRFFNPDTVLPPEPSPEGVLRGLAQRSTAEWSNRYERSAIKSRFVDQRAGRSDVQPSSDPRPRKLPSAVRQMALLTMRELVLKARDRWNGVILLVQAPIIALLIVLVFGAATRPEEGRSVMEAWPSVASVLFLANIAALWFGCSNAAREIVAERPVFARERMVGLRLFAYLGAKLVLLGLIGLIQCSLLLAIVRAGCAIEAEWPRLLAGLFLSALVGSSIGLTLSALARSSEVAISLVPIAILPMVMLGGMLRPVHEMDQPARTIAHLMPSRWALELAVDAEERRRPTEEVVRQEPPEAGSKSQAPVLLKEQKAFADFYFPAKNRTRPGTMLFVLAAQALLLIAGTLAVLRSRDVHL